VCSGSCQWEGTCVWQRHTVSRSFMLLEANSRSILQFSRIDGRGCTFSEVSNGQKDMQKHTTGGIPRWSPTLVLVARFSAYVWQSGRDAQFSLTYGRMYQIFISKKYIAQRCDQQEAAPRRVQRLDNESAFDQWTLWFCEVDSLHLSLLAVTAPLVLVSKSNICSYTRCPTGYMHVCSKMCM
jgi:hypothetical protein